MGASKGKVRTRREGSGPRSELVSPPAAGKTIAVPAPPAERRNDEVRFLSLEPRLAVADVARSRRFYERLGFRVTDQLPPSGSPEWLRLERSSAAIMIWNQVMAPPDVIVGMGQVRGAGNTICIRVSNVDRFALELRRRGVAVTQGPETMPDGIRELSVVDPDGFRLAFSSRIEKAEQGPGPSLDAPRALA